VLNSQSQYIDFLCLLGDSVKKAADAMSPAMDSIQQKFLDKANALVADIGQVRLLVPIVGAFSAGKSSLLNALLGDLLLPVAITPETSLAAELHFDTAQRIEAIPAKGAVEIFDLSAFDKVTARASEFEYLRVYVNAPVLKSMLPLILVDMPGFDAPLKMHDKAICNYIDRGVHYVVLVSVDDGGLTSQTLGRLQDIKDNYRSFSLCLSKIDLRPEAQINEIVGHISNQLSSELGLHQEVICLDQSNASEKLQTLVRNIDPDHLVRTLFNSSVANVFFDLDNTFSVLISSLGKTAQSIKEEQSAVRSAIEIIEREKKNEYAKVREGFGVSSHVQHVLNAVNYRLEQSLEVLIKSAMQGQEAFARQISDVCQSALVAAMRKVSGEVSEEAIRGFSRAISGNICTDLVLPPDMLTNLIEQVKDPLLQAILQKVNVPGKIGLPKKETVAMTGAMVAVAAGAAPWLIVAISLVPVITDLLFSSFKEGRQRDAILQALRTQIFPDILRQLRPDVESYLQEAMESALGAIAQKYEEHLAKHHQLLTELEINNDLGAIEDQKHDLVTLQDSFRSRAEVIVFETEVGVQN